MHHLYRLKVQSDAYVIASVTVPIVMEGETEARKGYETWTRSHDW